MLKMGVPEDDLWRETYKPSYFKESLQGGGSAGQIYRSLDYNCSE
ncbi:hypothetical protein PRIO_0118 [Paenibacillus riograndensis SBR5]|uniref:Uncharacterized protein n=1 Tax=Paenibacillus riograndensis SBR5 TaxID=1073571 RepID=A0A0E4H6P8_9BACL|nr:hypothetical protein PRIO_0118 [Paenibacillus riograndensis SBR5]